MTRRAGGEGREVVGRTRGALVLSTLSLTLVAAPVGPTSDVSALSTGVVISQVYGGGGNSGAPYTHDFVELFNRGSAPVSLTVRKPRSVMT